MNIPAPSAGAEAPKVKAGLRAAKFVDLVLKPHPDWATESDSYGKPDTGERYHFIFAPLDKIGGKQLSEDGEPIFLEKLTRTATGERSGFAATLRGILTDEEFAAWQANKPFDSEQLAGREVSINVTHNKNGWPQVEDVLPAMER